MNVQNFQDLIQNAKSIQEKIQIMEQLLNHIFTLSNEEIIEFIFPVLKNQVQTTWEMENQQEKQEYQSIILKVISHLPLILHKRIDRKTAHNIIVLCGTFLTKGIKEETGILSIRTFKEILKKFPNIYRDFIPQTLKLTQGIFISTIERCKQNENWKYLRMEDNIHLSKTANVLIEWLGLIEAILKKYPPQSLGQNMQPLVDYCTQIICLFSDTTLNFHFLLVINNILRNFPNITIDFAKVINCATSVFIHANPERVNDKKKILNLILRLLGNKQILAESEENATLILDCLLNYNLFSHVLLIKNSAKLILFQFYNTIYMLFRVNRNNSIISNSHIRNFLRIYFQFVYDPNTPIYLDILFQFIVRKMIPKLIKSSLPIEELMQILPRILQSYVDKIHSLSEMEQKYLIGDVQVKKCINDWMSIKTRLSFSFFEYYPSRIQLNDYFIHNFLLNKKSWELDQSQEITQIERKKVSRKMIESLLDYFTSNFLLVVESILHLREKSNSQIANPQLNEHISLLVDANQQNTLRLSKDRLSIFGYSLLRNFFQQIISIYVDMIVAHKTTSNKENLQQEFFQHQKKRYRHICHIFQRFPADLFEKMCVDSISFLYNGLQNEKEFLRMIRIIVKQSFPNIRFLANLLDFLIKKTPDFLNLSQNTRNAISDLFIFLFSFLDKKKPIQNQTESQTQEITVEIQDLNLYKYSPIKALLDNTNSINTNNLDSKDKVDPNTNLIGNHISQIFAFGLHKINSKFISNFQKSPDSSLPFLRFMSHLYQNLQESGSEKQIVVYLIDKFQEISNYSPINPIFAKITKSIAKLCFHKFAFHITFLAKNFQSFIHQSKMLLYSKKPAHNTIYLNWLKFLITNFNLTYLEQKFKPTQLAVIQKLIQISSQDHFDENSQKAFEILGRFASFSRNPFAKKLPFFQPKRNTKSESKIILDLFFHDEHTQIFHLDLTHFINEMLDNISGTHQTTHKNENTSFINLLQTILFNLVLSMKYSLESSDTLNNLNSSFLSNIHPQKNEEKPPNSSKSSRIWCDYSLLIKLFHTQFLLQKNQESKLSNQISKFLSLFLQFKTNGGSFVDDLRSTSRNIDYYSMFQIRHLFSSSHGMKLIKSLVEFFPVSHSFFSLPFIQKLFSNKIENIQPNSQAQNNILIQTLSILSGSPKTKDFFSKYCLQIFRSLVLILEHQLVPISQRNNMIELMQTIISNVFSIKKTDNNSNLTSVKNLSEKILCLLSTKFWSQNKSLRKVCKVLISKIFESVNFPIDDVLEKYYLSNIPQISSEIQTENEIQIENESKIANEKIIENESKIENEKIITNEKIIAICDGLSFFLFLIQENPITNPQKLNFNHLPISSYIIKNIYSEINTTTNKKPQEVNDTQKMDISEKSSNKNQESKQTSKNEKQEPEKDPQKIPRKLLIKKSLIFLVRTSFYLANDYEFAKKLIFIIIKGMFKGEFFEQFQKAFQLFNTLCEKFQETKETRLKLVISILNQEQIQDYSIHHFKTLRFIAQLSPVLLSDSLIFRVFDQVLQNLEPKNMEIILVLLDIFDQMQNTDIYLKTILSNKTVLESVPLIENDDFWIKLGKCLNKYHQETIDFFLSNLSDEKMNERLILLINQQENHRIRESLLSFDGKFSILFQQYMSQFSQFVEQIPNQSASVSAKDRIIANQILGIYQVLLKFKNFLDDTQDGNNHPLNDPMAESLIGLVSKIISKFWSENYSLSSDFDEIDEIQFSVNQEKKQNTSQRKEMKNILVSNFLDIQKIVDCLCRYLLGYFYQIKKSNEEKILQNLENLEMINSNTILYGNIFVDQTAKSNQEMVLQNKFALLLILISLFGSIPFKFDQLNLFQFLIEKIMEFESYPKIVQAIFAHITKRLKAITHSIGIHFISQINILFQRILFPIFQNLVISQEFFTDFSDEVARILKINQFFDPEVNKKLFEKNFLHLIIFEEFKMNLLQSLISIEIFPQTLGIEDVNLLQKSNQLIPHKTQHFSSIENKLLFLKTKILMKGGILGSNEDQILQIISEFIAKSDFEDEEEDLVQKMVTDLLNLGNEQSLTNQKQEDLQNEQIHEIGMDIEIPLLDEKPKSTFHSKVIELIQNQIAQASLSSSVTFKFLVSIIVKNTSFFYGLNEKAIVLMIHHFQCGMSDLNLGIDILSFVVDWFGDLKKKSEPTFSQLQKLRLQEEIFSILIAFSHLLSVSSGVFSRIKNIFKRCCLIFDNLNISFSGNLTQPTRILSLIKVPIKYNNWSFKFVHEQNLDKLIQTILLNSDLVDKEIIQNVIFIFTSFIQNKESFDGDALQFIDDLTNEINNVLAKLDLMKFKFAIIAEYFLFLYQQIPHLFAKHALKFYHFLKQAQVIHDFESHHEIEMKNQSNFHQAQNIIISETINNQQPQNSMQNYPNQIIENNQLMNQNSVLATNSILLQNLEIIIHTILLLKPEPSKLFEIMIDLVESAKSPAFLSVLLDQCFAILDSNTDPILFLKEITHKNDPKSNTSQMKIETKKEKVDEDPSNELIPKLAYEIPKDLSEKFVHSLMKRFNLVMEKCFDLVKEKFFGILIGLWRKDHSLVEVLIKYPHVLLKGVGACSQIPQIKKGVSEILGWATKSKSLEMKIETSILLFLNVSQFDFFCFHDFFANIVRIVIETFIEQSEKNQNSKNIASIHSILNQIYNLIQKESTILCSILPDFLDQVLDKVINTHEKRKNFIQICLEIMLKSSVVENHGKQREETKIQEERILSEFFGAISRIPEVVDIPAQISSFISQKYRIENQIAFLIEKNIEMKSKIENHHLISEIKIPFGIEDAKKEGRIGNFRELLRYYKKIGENEFIFGLCDGVIQESEKRKANYYQMIEKFDKSEKIVMRCLRKLSSTTNQNLAKKNENVETNYDLDEEQRFLEDEICRDLWVDASKNILSYESLLEFAKETFNFDLVLESLYRLGNFEAIQEVIKFHNFVPNNFQNHLIEFVSGLMIYANGNVGKYFDMENKDGKEQYFFTGEIQEKIRLGYHKLIYNVIQLFKNLFNSNQSRNLLPQIDSVLDVVQEVVEIGEFSDILLNFKSDNLEIISDDFRFFSQNLNAKIPNKTEKISFWNSLITTRMHMLSFFKGLERAETKKSMQKESGMNVDANLKTEKFRAILDEAVVENVLKLTNRYRINQMHNLLLLGYYPENENRNYSLIPNQGNSLMQMAQRSQFSTINTFHKLKIQLKSFDSLIRKTKQKLKRTPNKAYSYSQKPIPTKMNQLFKDVSHFFLVKPPTIQQVLVNTQQSEIGSLQAEIYSHLNEDLKASDIFLQGINQEKNINKNWERWGDFNQKLFRKSKEKTFLKRSLDCYIQAILLGGDQFGSLVSKVVYLANFCENFDLKESEQLSIWIPWIQQIIDSAYTLDYLENQNLNQESFFEKILSAISKNSPQTLYYSLRSHAHPKSTESKKREVSMNIFLKILENINLDQDSKKQIEKIEEMLELIVDNFRPEIEEELVCELRKLLSDCWSFVFFHLDSPQTELSLFNNLISEIIQQIEDTYIAKIQQRNEERKQVLTSLDEESANILSRFSEIFRQYTISSFQKFRDDVLNKTLNCNSCFDTIKIIRQWIEEIEMWLEKKHLATNVNQISLESEEGWQSIAIPGQNLFFNLSSTKKTQSSERIKIFQIYSEMEKVDQYKNISRRFFFRGDDGFEYPYLLQSQYWNHSSSKSRILQLIRFINIMINNELQSVNRPLRINHVPAITQINKEIVLLSEFNLRDLSHNNFIFNPSKFWVMKNKDNLKNRENNISSKYNEMISLYDIMKIHQINGKSDLFGIIEEYLEKIISSRKSPDEKVSDLDIADQNNQMELEKAENVDSSKYLSLFPNDPRLRYFLEVSEKHVPNDIMKKFILQCFGSFDDFSNFRKQFISQLSVNYLFQYILSIDSPSIFDFQFFLRSGNLSYYHNFIPNYNKEYKILESFENKIDKVPFRLTPNMMSFMTEIGVKGLFQSTVMNVSKTLLEKKNRFKNVIDVLFLNEMVFFNFSESEMGIEDIFRFKKNNVHSVFDRIEDLSNFKKSTNTNSNSNTSCDELIKISTNIKIISELSPSFFAWF